MILLGELIDFRAEAEEIWDELEHHEGCKKKKKVDAYSKGRTKPDMAKVGITWVTK